MSWTLTNTYNPLASRYIYSETKRYEYRYSYLSIFQ